MLLAFLLERGGEQLLDVKTLEQSQKVQSLQCELCTSNNALSSRVRGHHNVIEKLLNEPDGHLAESLFWQSHSCEFRTFGPEVRNIENGLSSNPERLSRSFEQGALERIFIFQIQWIQCKQNDASKPSNAVAASNPILDSVWCTPT